MDFTVPTFEHIVLSNSRLVNRYGGVSQNVLNPGPLTNALALTNGPVFGVDQFPTVEEKAAKIAFAIATGHVFSDANKRTAASALDLTLELNGYALMVSEDDLVVTMYALAKDEMAWEPFLQWVRERAAPGGQGTLV